MAEERRFVGMPCELNILDAGEAKETQAWMETVPLRVMGGDEEEKLIIWKYEFNYSRKTAKESLQRIRQLYENARVALGQDYVQPTLVTLGQRRQKNGTYTISVYQPLGEVIADEHTSELYVVRKALRDTELEDLEKIDEARIKLDSELNPYKDGLRDFYENSLVRATLLGYLPDAKRLRDDGGGTVRLGPIALSGNLCVDSRDNKVKLFDFGDVKLNLFPLKVREVLAEYLDNLTEKGYQPIVRRQGSIEFSPWYKEALISAFQASGFEEGKSTSYSQALEKGLALGLEDLNTDLVSNKPQTEPIPDQIKSQFEAKISDVSTKGWYVHPGYISGNSISSGVIPEFDLKDVIKYQMEFYRRFVRE